MHRVVSALDNYTPSQLGENGTEEYTWSNYIPEKITQLHFQLVRNSTSSSASTCTLLPLVTRDILIEIRSAYLDNRIDRETFYVYLSVMYRIVAQTRDIVEGKGEYSLAYMLLKVWYQQYPELTKFVFKHFLVSQDSLPYGSWKDIKYIYVIPELKPLAQYGIQLMIQQLKKDEANSQTPDAVLSLVAKWVPREKSRYSDMFGEMAVQYYPEYFRCCTNEKSYYLAVLKAKTCFRKLISGLNKRLDTVQVKQCANQWATIDPAKQTSITMHKQKHAFLNQDKRGNTRYPEVEDRVVCADRFKEYIGFTSAKIKGKRVSIVDFVKEAFSSTMSKEVEQILNIQWVDNATQNGVLNKMVAMVDVSGSMTRDNGNPLYAAIGLGIRIAEKSSIGKRVLTFESKPTWVNLEKEKDFISMVRKIKGSGWGGSTNFAAALDMLLVAIIQHRLPPEEVEDMVLVVLSDMQMDMADGSRSDKWVTIMEERYAKAGNKLWGVPFKTPHILFWNLRSTRGFPTLSSKKNTSMMSGFSPILLNTFCEQGKSALENTDGWSLLVKSLDKERYNFLDTYLRNNI
jgi:Domain of unknown function (DUF2828)